MSGPGYAMNGSEKCKCKLLAVLLAMSELFTRHIGSFDTNQSR